MSHLLLLQPFFENWSVTGIITAIIAFIAGLAALIDGIKTIKNDGWKELKDKWITPFKTRRKQRAEMQNQLKDVINVCGSHGEMLLEIMREVKPNGGESLKDRILKIDSKLDSMTARTCHYDETSEIPIFHLDETGRLVFANCAFREMLGVEEKELSHSNYLSLIERDQRSAFIREIDEAIKFKMPIDTTLDFKMEGPNFVAIRLQASPDVRHGGELKGFFGTAVRVENSDSQHLSQA